MQRFARALTLSNPRELENEIRGVNEGVIDLNAPGKVAPLSRRGSQVRTFAFQIQNVVAFVDLSNEQAVWHASVALALDRRSHVLPGIGDQTAAAMEATLSQIGPENDVRRPRWCSKAQEKSRPSSLSHRLSCKLKLRKAEEEGFEPSIPR